MEKSPLSHYVIAVVIVLALVNCLHWYLGGEARLKTVGSFSIGFMLGMLAMYIAVHLYRWK